MLTKYFEAAMQHAVYEQLSTGVWFGSIPGFQGLWAEGDTRGECAEDLRAALEVWVMVGIYRHHRLPIVDGIDLAVAEAA
jgi:predicted RNase H-like HicB family nuclease